MDILLSKEIGYCYGVRDAVNTVIKLSQNNRVQTWGPVIHNPNTINTLKEEYGVSHIDKINEFNADKLVVRAHGVSPDTLNVFKENNISVADATCPFVSRTQNIARKLMEDGYFVVILGKRKHPEVLGIQGYVKDKSIIVQNKEDIKYLSKKKKIGIVFQSTITIDDVGHLIPEIAKKCKELKIHTTVCDVTTRRQEEIRELARKVDLMLIIGGKNSSNTTKLKDIAKELNENSIQIENCNEIKDLNLDNIKSIGISTGTSTPKDIIDKIINEINKKLHREREKLTS